MAPRCFPVLHGKRFLFLPSFRQTGMHVFSRMEDVFVFLSLFVGACPFLLSPRAGNKCLTAGSLFPRNIAFSLQRTPVLTPRPSLSFSAGKGGFSFSNELRVFLSCRPLSTTSERFTLLPQATRKSFSSTPARKLPSGKTNQLLFCGNRYRC